MLSHDRVHGDLSAFNVLVWDGRAFVIDFPQAVVASVNPNARQLLDRDVARLAQHFARYGVHADAGALAADLWARYERGIL
jgi:RIO kinase 1